MLKAREDSDLGTHGLNLDSPARERKDPTNKESLFHKEPELSLFAKNESPSNLLVVEQPVSNQRRTEDAGASEDDGQTFPASVNTQLQVVHRGVAKAETAVGANTQMGGENPLVGEQKAFEDKKPNLVFKSTDASFGKVMKREKSTQAYTDGERDVKLLLEEGSFEPQSGKPFEVLGGKPSESEENTQFSDRENPNLQHQEIKQSSLENKKRVKDIRALWEREETPKLESKGDVLNKNTSASNTILNSSKESHRVKPVGGSSGYVTAESDSEQGKYNVVTFRKVILNEDESEPDDDGSKLSSGRSTPRLIDRSKQSYPIDTSGKMFPGDQKNEFSEHSDGVNLRLRPSTKEGEYFQPIVLEKEKTTSAQKQISHFQIHSLKEKLDEDAKAQMLSPSQFQSLRSFWDAGVKPQSRTDEYNKVMVTVPRSGKGRARDYKEEPEMLKEVEVRTSQAVLEDKQEKQTAQEEKVDKPNAKVSTQNLLEATSTNSKEVGPPVPSPSVNAAPKGSLEFVLPKDHYLEGGNVHPVEEYIGKTEAPSRRQLNSFSSDLRKLLMEASQEFLLATPPADEKGLVAQAQMPLDDQAQHHHQGVPAERQVGVSASEVTEAADSTLAPSKADARALDVGSENQLKGPSDAKNSPKHSVVEDVSGQAVSLSEQRRFFDQVMKRSHDSYPSGRQKGPAEPEETEEIINKHTTSRDPHAGFNTGTEILSRAMEKSHSGPGKAPDMEEGHRHLGDPASQGDVFQIPSVKLVLPGAVFAAQNKANSPATEVFETVTEVNVPSKKKCSDMDAKIACLLNASSAMPCVLPTTENVLKMHCKESSVLASLQGASSSREIMSNTNASEDSGPVLSTVENELGDEVTVTLPFKSQNNLKAGGCVISGDEQPEDVAETVVKAIKANAYEPAAFKASLSKFLKEDSGVTETQLQTDQNVNSIYEKVAPHLPEIIERIEKTTLPSNPRQAELKASFQKLLQEESEILPTDQESRANNNRTQIEGKSNWREELFDQQEEGQEISETVNKTASPSNEKQTEFNSGLQKVLEDATWMQSIQLASLDGPESIKEFPQEVKETVIKSTAPAKDDAVFSSNLGKLIRESSDGSLQVSMEDHPEVLDDSASQLKKQNSSVKRLASAANAPNEFRTEVKIPLKGKPFKQDDQIVEGIPERITVFQKTVQVNTLSAEAAHPGRGKDSPSCSKMDEREREYEREVGAEVATASLGDANEASATDVLQRSQSSSSPRAEKQTPLRVSRVELRLGTQNPDGKNKEDEDGRSFGSDLSDENSSYFVRFQRSRTRSEEEPSPVMEALKRSSNRQIPSQSLEDIPSATSNKRKINLPKEDYMLSAEDVSTAPSFPDSQFSRPEKIKQMSKSVPVFVQEESDDRETDSASDKSYPLGRIKKSPSSLTNLSGSSGLASLSSVSTSVMSVYSGDFGNIDVKGNIQFAIDYVEQLKELHIFIAQGKDLAVADVKKQRSDPYVKSYLLPEKYKLGKRKTSVKKKTLNPVFNEILRYKVDKELLATQRLNISVWHNDTFGRNSFLGEVELDLGSWDWNDKQNKQMIWYPLKPRTPLASLEAENRGEIKIALQYVPQPTGGKKTPATGEVHIWVKECNDLPILRGNKLNSFVKCTILPDTSRKSRQKTRAVAKTTNPIFNHTMVYDGFRPEDLKEACVELTVWDHNKLANHFLGGLRIGLGTGKSYGTPVDWMDSTCDEINLWERMINSPNTWVEDTLPLRMLTIVKMAK
ncbi:synaptotagmin-like protein 2 isoform X2 [Pogona vitticeps]